MIFFYTRKVLKYSPNSQSMSAVQNNGSSHSENLLEASINRVPAKLAVRDKFEKLLYLPSSSTFRLSLILHVALNALHGMSYQW